MFERHFAAALALCSPAFPFAAMLLLGLSLLLGVRHDERLHARMVSAAFSLSLISALGVSGYFVAGGEASIQLALGSWFGTGRYGFELSLLVDRLSAPMMALTAALCGLIGRFSATYLHREPGQPRFYLLLSTFATGMFLLVMAGSLDLLIAGWELVGISSMLLIGFFHDHTFPVRNALRAFVTYRVCDIGLLVGTVLMHHYAGTGDFAQALGGWPGGHSNLSATSSTVIACCLLWAACGKSALFPVGSWLPRAMEGPTPASAIFYGSLSVHAGAYLMLRVSPLLEHAPLARALLVAVGILTALHGTLVARVQTDVKSQLAYATTTQVGVIFAEIGLGFPRLALIHILSHASVRTLQLLRAPNAIQDAALRKAAEREDESAPQAARPTRRARQWLYHLALERFHLDAFWEHTVIAAFLQLGARIDAFEQSLVAGLSGTSSKKARPGARSHELPGRSLP